MKFDLLGLGECMVELYADQPLGVASRLEKRFGGDVLNSLIAAARLGLKTGFITRVGDDPFGVGLLTAWQLEGVDTSFAPLVAGENGVYFISLTAGEREFTYRRVGSAASSLEPSDIRFEMLQQTRAILLSGITQAISSSAQAATQKAAQLAKQAGALVIYDPNYRPKLWAARGALELAQQACAALLPLCDVVLPSFPADAELLGVSSLKQTAHAFAQHGAVCVVKCAEQGAYLAGHGMVATEAVRVIDSTGAGDAWNGAFIHAYLATHDPLLATRAAHRIAAQKLLHRGAIPPRLEVI
ncbi:MAG: sugar kinase [Deinococcales bacterium]